MALASSVAVIWPVLRFNAWQFLSLWYRLEPGLSETYTLPPEVTSVWKASASALLEEDDNLPIAKPIIKKPMQRSLDQSKRTSLKASAFYLCHYLKVQSSLKIFILLLKLA